MQSQECLCRHQEEDELAQPALLLLFPPGPREHRQELRRTRSRGGVHQGELRDVQQFPRVDAPRERAPEDAGAGADLGVRLPLLGQVPGHQGRIASSI